MLLGGLDFSGIIVFVGKEFVVENKIFYMYFVDFVNSVKDFELIFVCIGLDVFWVKCVFEYVGIVYYDIIVNVEELVNYLFVFFYVKDLLSVGEMEILLYLLFCEMKKDVIVVLFGELVDEVFGGYFWFY